MKCCRYPHVEGGHHRIPGLSQIRLDMDHKCVVEKLMKREEL